MRVTRPVDVWPPKTDKYDKVILVSKQQHFT